MNKSSYEILPAPANHSWPTGHIIDYSRLSPITAGLLATSLPTAGSFCSDTADPYRSQLASWPHHCLQLAPSILIQPAPDSHSWPPGHIMAYSRLLLISYIRLLPVTAGLMAISLSTAGSF